MTDHYSIPYRWARLEGGSVLYSSMGPMPKVFAIRVVTWVERAVEELRSVAEALGLKKVSEE